MKAKVIETGDIIEVSLVKNTKSTYVDSNNNFYPDTALEFIPEIDWEQRRFELVKAIIPGILSNELLITRLEKTIPEIQDEGNIDVIASLAIGYADAVIKELKEE